jgi:hypothetical protein
MDSTSSTRTRRALHGLGELVLAGPQYRRSGTIRLRVAPDGIATVQDPGLRIEADALVAGGHRLPLTGTFAELGERAGVDVGAPAGLYEDGAGVDPKDEIAIDSGEAARFLECFARGDEALRRLGGDDPPVLWPEHFDLAITLDEVNYGVSLGDGYLAEPYAYVGPWQPRRGPFWNAPFGAARPLAGLPDPDDVAAFFRDGRDRARHDAPASP